MAKLDPLTEGGNYQLPGDFPEDDGASLNPREKALRDAFVVEYMIDFNSVKAAQRIGFHRQFAIEYAQRFMEEPYVQKKINEIKFKDIPERDMAEYDKKRIKGALMQEAHYFGPGSSHSARVAALGRLATLNGLDAPKKIEQTLLHKGGVMAVPGIANLDDWEKTAAASQDKLVEHARSI